MAIDLQTIKEKEEQIIADVDSATGQTTPPLEIAWNRLFARAFAGLSKIFDKLVISALKNVYLSTCTSIANLTEWSGWTKTPRKDATAAILNVEGTGVAAANIVGGLSGIQYVSEDGQKFYFPADYLIPGTGIVDTQVKAFIPGAQANLYTGTLSITAQNANISDTLTIKIADPINTAGTEQESVDSWKGEMQRVAQKPVTSDNFSFYNSTARQVDNIIAGYAYTDKPGQLNLYGESDSDDGIPTDDQITAITEWFDGTTDGEVRLPTDMEGNLPDDAAVKRFRVFKTTRTEFHADVSALLPDTTANRTSIDDAIKAYFTSLKPYIKGVSVENNGVATQQALRSIVQATIITIGADSFYDVTFKKVSNDVQYATYPLGEGERAYANDSGWIS